MNKIQLRITAFFSILTIFSYSFLGLAGINQSTIKAFDQNLKSLNETSEANYETIIFTSNKQDLTIEELNSESDVKFASIKKLINNVYEGSLNSETKTRYKINGTDISDKSALDFAVANLSKNNLINKVAYNSKYSIDWVPNDPKLPNQWALNNTITPGYDIQAYKAWNLSNGHFVTKVAVLDTGVDYKHPDLKNNVIKLDKGIDYDFTSTDLLPMDRNGHGTHVAGIVAAEANNNIGIAGVCPSCTIIPIKVMSDSGSGYLGWVMEGLALAEKLDANIVNMSFGSLFFNQIFQDEINRLYYKNISFVAAAGNEFTYLPFYPAAYKNVISVSSYNKEGKLSWFSNYGPSVDTAAPGEGILSTKAGGGYVKKSGTSMAAPHVSGIVALALTSERYNKDGSTMYDPSKLKNMIMEKLIKQSSVANPNTFLEGTRMIKARKLLNSNIIKHAAIYPRNKIMEESPTFKWNIMDVQFYLTADEYKFKLYNSDNIVIFEDTIEPSNPSNALNGSVSCYWYTYMDRGCEYKSNFTFERGIKYYWQVEAKNFGYTKLSNLQGFIIK